MELELMRSCVLEALRRQPATQYENLKYTVATVAKERGLPVDAASGNQSYLLPVDFRRYRETIWALVNEGVVVPGMDDSNPTWPFLSLTEYGQEVAQTGNPTPHDMGGYLARLVAQQALEPIEERYVVQALEAYNRNLPDAAAVMLGCASEHLVIRLVESIGAKDPTVAAKAAKLLDGPALGLHRFALEYFEERKAKLPRDLREGINTIFAGVATLIRVARNDAGHPALSTVDRETAFINLQLFPKHREWVLAAMTLLPL